MISILIIFLTLYLHSKKIIGGADGKILIALSLIIIALYDLKVLMLWLISVFLIYVISILYVVIKYTSFQINRSIFLSYDFELNIALKVVAFAIFKETIDNFLFKETIGSITIYIILWILVKFLFLEFAFIFIKSLFKKSKKLNKHILFLFFIIIYLYEFVSENFLFHIVFFLYVGLSYFVYHISNVVDTIRIDNQKFYSPFSIYLIFAFVLIYVLLLTDYILYFSKYLIKFLGFLG